MKRPLMILLALLIAAGPVFAAAMVYSHTFTADGSSTADVLKPGIWTAKITGTFDSATVDLQYSLDGGSTYSDVHVAALANVTAAMTTTAEIRVSKSTLFKWTAAGGGASMDIDCWMAYSGDG